MIFSGTALANHSDAKPATLPSQPETHSNEKNRHLLCREASLQRKRRQRNTMSPGICSNHKCERKSDTMWAIATYQKGYNPTTPLIRVIPPVPLL